MAMTSNNEIRFQILEHIDVIDRYKIKDEVWTKEINLVSWNDRPAKIDIRDWNSAHDRMSKGITLTEKQALTMARLLASRYRSGAAPTNL